jgi:hypothetical protein
VLDRRGKTAQKFLFCYPALPVREDNQIPAEFSLFFCHGFGTRLKFTMPLLKVFNAEPLPRPILTTFPSILKNALHAAQPLCTVGRPS